VAAQVIEVPDHAAAADDHVGEVNRASVVTAARQNRRGDGNGRRAATALKVHVRQAADEADVVFILRPVLIARLGNEDRPATERAADRARHSLIDRKHSWRQVRGETQLSRDRRWPP